jgi:hypothetical protein
MLVSIGTYAICDGTLAGGVAISGLLLKSDRLFEFVIPIGDSEVYALNFDRVNSKTDLTFTVGRTWGSVALAETFILQLDTLLPSTGVITLTTTGPSPDTRVIENGVVMDHTLISESGATTFHKYHIVGGPPVAP